jgi:four helix bundle protein
MQNYKELLVWQKSHSLTLDVFRLTKELPKDEWFILTSQLKRACLSVPLNIVEGCGRYTDADTANFFQTSLGSVQETKYCLLLAKDLEYITLTEYDAISQKAGEVKAMLISLIQKLRVRKSR